jgi:hypothetical protein
MKGTYGFLSLTTAFELGAESAIVSVPGEATHRHAMRGHCLSKSAILRPHKSSSWKYIPKNSVWRAIKPLHPPPHRPCRRCPCGSPLIPRLVRWAAPRRCACA